jgi:hypothetical protein
MMAVNKHTRWALAESVTYRIIAAVDASVMSDIEADVLRSIASVMPDRAPVAHLEELQRVMLRAWRRSGDELLAQMAGAQAHLISDG